MGCSIHAMADQISFHIDIRVNQKLKPKDKIFQTKNNTVSDMS